MTQKLLRVLLYQVGRLNNLLIPLLKHVITFLYGLPVEGKISLMNLTI